MKTLYIFLFLFTNTSIFTQWQYLPTSENETIYSITSKGNNVIIATQFGGIWISSNNGTNWTQSMVNRSVFSLAANSSRVFAGTFSQGLFVSTDDGMTWPFRFMGSNDIYGIGIKDSAVFAGSNGSGVYYSSNNGISFSQTSLNNQKVHAFAFKNNKVFAGTENGIYSTTNNGINWVVSGLSGQDIRAMVTNGNNIYAGSFTSFTYGVYVSSDNGSSWVLTPLHSAIYSLTTVDNYIFAGTSFGGIYVSSNNGASWVTINEGLTGYYISAGAIHIFNNYIFAGIYDSGPPPSTDSYGLHRRVLGEIVGIQNGTTELPSMFMLKQNYPNPFNPETVVKFSVGKASQIKISVYNLLGGLVDVMISGNYPPGEYETKWNASSLSGGVYFYSLKADGVTIDSKKMMLIK